MKYLFYGLTCISFFASCSSYERGSSLIDSENYEPAEFHEARYKLLNHMSHEISRYLHSCQNWRDVEVTEKGISGSQQIYRLIGYERYRVGSSTYKRPKYEYVWLDVFYSWKDLEYLGEKDLTSGMVKFLFEGGQNTRPFYGYWVFEAKADPDAPSPQGFFAVASEREIGENLSQSIRNLAATMLAQP
ncbi:MAG: hypothetical protein AAGC44_14365 [Planctomycetota bacterium]